jgi:hypothetical protein
MKPAKLKAERERRAKIEFRKLARQIPDNEKLKEIVLKLADQRPIQEGFYRNVVPFLKFAPIPLQEIRNEN